MPELHRYAVGQPYLPGGRRVPTSTQYTYRAGQHELLLCLGRLSAREIRSVRSGPCAFALCVDPPVITLCWRFDPAFPWSDAPFSIHLVPEAERTLPPETTPESHALLSIILVDADTGLVAALRAVALSLAFTWALHTAIRNQAALPWDAAAYDAALAALQRRYTSTELVQRAIAQTPGGA